MSQSESTDGYFYCSSVVQEKLVMFSQHTEIQSESESKRHGDCDLRVQSDLYDCDTRCKGGWKTVCRKI